MRALAHFVILATIPIGVAAQPTPSSAARHDSLVLHNIEARMRTASGTLIRGRSSMENAVFATDLVRFARGFTWKGPTRVQTRGTAGTARRSARCESIPRSDSLLVRGTKAVAVYLDGTRVPGGLELINRMVPVADILAIEAYPDVLSAPSFWRTNDACAVLAFWTKRPN